MMSSSNDRSDRDKILDRLAKHGTPFNNSVRGLLLEALEDEGIADILLFSKNSNRLQLKVDKDGYFYWNNPEDVVLIGPGSQTDHKSIGRKDGEIEEMVINIPWGYFYDED